MDNQTLPTSQPRKSPSRTREPRSRKLTELTSVVAILAWAALLLKYQLTEELALLVHPRFNLVVLFTSITLFIVGSTKAITLRQKQPIADVQHLNFLPVGWTNWLLIFTAAVGCFTSPQPLNSSAASQQGITDGLISTRVQVQSFRGVERPEERSMLDWAKTLTAYPEPDRYAGQLANVMGFVVRSPKLSDRYFVVTRFVIMHCALDAFPVGLTVKLPESQMPFEADTWLEVRGRIVTETLDDQRHIVIHAESLKTVAAPKNPYEFN